MSSDQNSTAHRTACYFPNLMSYLSRGIGTVEGWLSPTAASVIANVLVRQVQDGMSGDVCEIGVHHGRLFLVLANVTLPTETAVAVDVFSEQEKNLDQSGHGDRAIFERNAATYAPGAKIDVIQASSLDLQRSDFLSRRFRFISIDGGHTAPVTANDLWLAERTLTERGVVALDDILGHLWTGVITGLVRYKNEGGSLVPCALLPNKLLLAKNAAQAAEWRAHLKRHFPLAVAKADLEFLDAHVESYFDHPYYDHETNIGLQNDCDALQRKCDALSAELGEARQLVAALHGSTSWRSTAVLRLLGGGLRRKA